MPPPGQSESYGFAWIESHAGIAGLYGGGSKGRSADKSLHSFAASGGQNFGVPVDSNSLPYQR
jgi:hypothetical protein